MRHTKLNVDVTLTIQHFISCVCLSHSVPTAREQLKKLSVLPTQVLKEYPCLSYWSVLCNAISIVLFLV